MLALMGLMQCDVVVKQLNVRRIWSNAGSMLFHPAGMQMQKASMLLSLVPNLLTFACNQMTDASIRSLDPSREMNVAVRQIADSTFQLHAASGQVKAVCREMT